MDHTGIDLIAKNPQTNELMGISVKSRSRNPGKDKTDIRFNLSNLEKVRNACDAFGYTPYFAFVIDATSKVRVFITSLDHLLVVFPPTKTSISWKMRDKNIKMFYDDPQIMIFELETSTYRWWQEPA